MSELNNRRLAQPILLTLIATLTAMSAFVGFMLYVEVVRLNEAVGRSVPFDYQASGFNKDSNAPAELAFAEDGSIIDDSEDSEFVGSSSEPGTSSSGSTNSGDSFIAAPSGSSSGSSSSGSTSGTSGSGSSNSGTSGSSATTSASNNTNNTSGSNSGNNNTTTTAATTTTTVPATLQTLSGGKYWSDTKKPTSVALLGNAQMWGVGVLADPALQSRGMSLHTIQVLFADSLAGRTAEMNSRSGSWKGASTVVVDWAIDSTESPSQFLADARAFNNMIRSHNPDAQIVWMEAWACDTSGLGSLQTVQDRWQANNNSIHTMLNAKEIDGVVSWAQAAAAGHAGDVNFYESNCTQLTDKQPYADAISWSLSRATG